MAKKFGDGIEVCSVCQCEVFPVVMRYTIDRKSWYNFVAGEFTEEDFQKHAMREAMNRVYSRMQEHPDDYSRFSVEMMKVGAQRLQLP